MKYFTFIFLFFLLKPSPSEKGDLPAKQVFTKEQLRDKIRGGWAGQTIGATFGSPIAFRFSGITIHDGENIPWYKGYLKETFVNKPDLYDDLFMDLTFVKVFEKEGLKAPISSLAKAYAEAEYVLSHANQAGRYNILNGIAPPLSGHWLNNPHADDIDFQIEADFAGLMSPGMPRSASQICDKVGHIMSYGDGYYGGLYVANLYSQAFINNKIDKIVNDAIRSIPQRTGFYQCINDVVRWHKMYPDDWKHTWFELQKEWANDIGCPEGVNNILDTDAKLNAAYVTMGLLYGNGDFTKTIEITTRAGQHSKCNSSSAAGILGVVLGFKKIPDFWKQDIEEIESIPFKYTGLSLNDAYEMSYKHALKMIVQHDGKIKNNNITLLHQKPLTAKFERNFEGHYPVEKRCLENKIVDNQLEFEFEGIGFVLKGEAASQADYTFQAEMYINNKFIEKAMLPSNIATRRSELFWKYQLPYGKHNVKIVILNPSSRSQLKVTDLIVYDVNNY